MRTIRAKKDWFDYLCDNCLGSSGRGGSLAGMRRKFWGNDAYVVRCREHLFWVTEETFFLISEST